MKIAVVTGASSGIGKSIARRLAEDGYEVYGFGRSFPDSMVSVPHFQAIVCDLRDTGKVLREMAAIRKKGEVSLLVLCGGTAYYGLHEELNPAKIEEMVSVNLTSPLILTQQCLRDLKKTGGTVVLMSSVTAQQSSPHGCAYAATKAGLSSFGRSLFDEVRKYGVKVLTVHPDMTATNLYRHADFTVDDDPQAYLNPEDVASAVMFALAQKEVYVLHELTLKPQLHRIRKKSKTECEAEQKQENPGTE
ncbi:MAG: SDR family oxidoreductase [Clostridia bacterium]|nr:SDR family oxidoreductase [Clostridia bacterium]